MDLEDHLGDIIRKARMMSGVSTAAAAEAAGVSASEYSRLEETGQSQAECRLAALAPLVGLNAQKLEKIATGWRPSAKDLSRWRELRVIVTAEGGMTVNCFLAWDPATREAALFDTGFEAAPVLKLIVQERLDLRHVFITHGHEDHVAGLREVQHKFPSATLHMDGLPQHRNRRNECIPLGSLRVTNRDTPGHASDGVTYILEGWPGGAPSVAAVGDALFSGSMGRAASWDPARSKVRGQVLSLPAETLICPGHGPLTTVGEELAGNPFFE
jgi:glyoxylase-like metal-dependent hydrolase (beta-lactamase superfamily II)